MPNLDRASVKFRLNRICNRLLNLFRPSSLKTRAKRPIAQEVPSSANPRDVLDNAESRESGVVTETVFANEPRILEVRHQTPEFSPPDAPERPLIVEELETSSPSHEPGVNLITKVTGRPSTGEDVEESSPSVNPEQATTVKKPTESTDVDTRDSPAVDIFREIIIVEDFEQSSAMKELSESTDKYFTDFADSITKAMKKNYDDNKFLPCHKVRYFASLGNVEKALKMAKVNHAEQMKTYVLNKAQKIFLILILLGGDKWLWMLERFQEDNMGDDNLPIDWNDPSDDDLDQGRYAYSLEGKHDNCRYMAISQWHTCSTDDRNIRGLFEYHQWKLLAPTFGDGQTFRRTFYSRRILPFMKRAPEPSSSGFFGEVSRVEMHSAHISSPGSQELGELETIAVAVKKTKSSKEAIEYFDSFEREAGALEAILKIEHPHLIKPIAAYQLRGDRCLIFPWADGGNFSDYWQKFDKGASRKSIEWGRNIKWILCQMTGICDALKKMHSNNSRHNDLKPDNILWFKGGDDDKGCSGSLQIADMGLAKFHDKGNLTHIRKKNAMFTGTPSGTSRYEPPEIDKDRGRPEVRSRAYDIWSMGCIILEMLVWLLHGHSAVERFGGKTNNYFWEMRDSNYHVHPFVVAYCKWISEILPQNNAFRDILVLIQERLLVVKVNEGNQSSPQCREIAAKLHEKMKAIQQRSNEDPSYLSQPEITFSLTEIHQRQVAVVHQSGGSLAVPNQTNGAPAVGATSRPPPKGENVDDINTDAGGPRVIVRTPTANGNLGAPKHPTRSDQASKLNNTRWTSAPDNEFARRLLPELDWEKFKPETPGISLCCRCQDAKPMRLFDRPCDLSKLKPSCDLCSMLLKALARHDITPPSSVSLREDWTVIGLEDGPDLLSIYCDPVSIRSDNRQIGLPHLLDRGSFDHFTLLKKWIAVCDEAHDTCARKVTQKGSDISNDYISDDFVKQEDLPTRLIYVGGTTRLVLTASIEKPYRYAALSHCWGQLKDDEKFCTFGGNVSELAKSIEVQRLPKTFRDAIIVTRELGLDYIWIDSLCIIQDDEEDWRREAANMELVFSSAYITICASSAESSLQGFLDNPSLEVSRRKVVQLRVSELYNCNHDNGAMLYVCPSIDDFEQDVELGALNRRGWVLQERTLSRRSIHYTSNQVYWECGAGVHCETLAKLRNFKAAFFGDANFPQSALEYYRDGRLLLIQNLYEQYSGLALTVPTDRPVAIAGLQARMARTLFGGNATRAAHGLFEAHFGRWLLWKRAGDKLMECILWRTTQEVKAAAGRRLQTATGGLQPPTWSWVSKMGAIRYLTGPRFSMVDWAEGTDYDNPFRSLGPGESLTTLKGLARRVELSVEEMDEWIFFDYQREWDVKRLLCVVIGRDKAEEGDNDADGQHVLVITNVSDRSEMTVYKRIGVASLLSRHVGEVVFRVDIH